MKSKRAREAADVEDRPADEAADVPAKKRKRTDEDGETLKESKPKKEKKDKKDKKDKKKDKKESRKERKDKRKDLQDLPEDDDEPEDEATGEPKPKTNGDATAESKDSEAELKLKKEKKEKKKEKKKENKAKHAPAATEAMANGTTTAIGEPPSDEPAGAPAETNGEVNGEDAIDLDASAASKADRHIVFVGNLPYTATAASISAHFASLSPIAVRCLKNRDDSNPCRGIAFVEFGKVWHQRTCLDKFHHSVFNDGVSPARKINVELTAGGGGKTKQRQDKIKQKNKKLEENRTKRIEREKEAKTNNAEKKDPGQSIEDAVHPSRRGRVPGGGQ